MYIVSESAHAARKGAPFLAWLPLSLGSLPLALCCSAGRLSA